MTEHIDGLDRAAYAGGRDPLDWAIQKTRDYIDVHAEVVYTRQADPAAFPGYCIPLDTEALARRIVGGLMDAGWTPPSPDGAPTVRHYLLHGEPVTVPVRFRLPSRACPLPPDPPWLHWLTPPRGAPRNALVRYPDGRLAVRPFRGLRRSV